MGYIENESIESLKSKLTTPKTHKELMLMMQDEEDKRIAAESKKTKFQKNAEKYGIGVAKSIEAGYMKQPKDVIQIGSYRYKGKR